MITAKMHRTGSEAILAACDTELLGRVFEEGDLSIAVDVRFFGETEITEDEFRGMLAAATSANIVGPRSMAVAVEEGCVHPDAVKHVSGVPYAMFFCMG